MPTFHMIEITVPDDVELEDVLNRLEQEGVLQASKESGTIWRITNKSFQNKLTDYLDTRYNIKVKANEIPGNALAYLMEAAESKFYVHGWENDCFDFIESELEEMIDEDPVAKADLMHFITEKRGTQS